MKNTQATRDYFPVIIITGGFYNRSDVGIPVEVLSPSGVPLPCTLPPLPISREGHNDRFNHACGHTQDGEVACSGSSCVTLTAEGWQESHQLQQRRWSHCSWRSPAGLLLMGGGWYGSGQTTELLTDTSSSSSPSFSLEYDTR